MHEEISIIIMQKNISHRDIAMLRRCLLSVTAAWKPKRYEVIVVSPHTEKLKRLLKDFRLNLKYVRDEGRGIGAARNTAIKKARYSIVSFVDPDSVVGTSHFRRILDTFKIDPCIGLVGVKGIQLQRWIKTLNSLQILEYMTRCRNGKNHFCDQRAVIKDIAFVTGTFLSFRRKVFDDIGGFWTYPPFGADDMDFSLRAYLKKWKIAIIKVPGSMHFPRESLMEIWREQYGWGFGFGFLTMKYRGRVEPWFFWRSSKFLYRFLPSSLRFTIPLLRFLFTPFRTLTYALRLRNISLIPYMTFKRFAFLSGYISALRKYKKILVAKKI